jgi:hypothetical protein
LPLKMVVVESGKMCGFASILNIHSAEKKKSSAVFFVGLSVLDPGRSVGPN